MIEQHLSLPHVVRRSAGQGGAPPMLVLLHGYGSNEHDLFGLAPYLDERLLIVSARAPLTLMPGGYAWFNLGFQQGGGMSFDLPGMLRQIERVAAFVEEAATAYGADPQRIVLGGFSQGAIMTAATLLRRPGLLAGALLLSGALFPGTEAQILPPDFNPEALADLPVLITHGTHDPVLPVELGRACRNLLERYPVDLTYREYPMGHEINLESLRDVADWLRARVNTPLS
ncbi:MAG TPA: phospholipase [Roseiflexaceae bacterium]|nr:phospholipase [Roseiflexaceae bacterium]